MAFYDTIIKRNQISGSENDTKGKSKMSRRGHLTTSLTPHELTEIRMIAREKGMTAQGFRDNLIRDAVRAHKESRGKAEEAVKV